MFLILFLIACEPVVCSDNVKAVSVLTPVVNCDEDQDMKVSTINATIVVECRCKGVDVSGLEK